MLPQNTTFTFDTFWTFCRSYFKVVADNFCPTRVSKWDYFLRAPTTTSPGQNTSLFIHLVLNGGVKADWNSARQPAWLDRQSAIIFPGDFVLSDSQNCIVKGRLIEIQPKLLWCYFRELHCAIHIYFIMICLKKILSIDSLNNVLNSVWLKMEYFLNYGISIFIKCKIPLPPSLPILFYILMFLFHLFLCCYNNLLFTLEADKLSGMFFWGFFLLLHYCK